MDLVKRKPWLSIITLVYIAGMIAVSIPKSMEITNDSDYYALYQAGSDFSRKHELYYRSIERPFYYPPFAAFILVPMQFFPMKISALLFFLLNSLLLLPLAIYLLYRILKILGYSEKNTGIVLKAGNTFGDSF